MPFTASEIAAAGKASLDFYLKNKPVDQVGIEHPLLKKLMSSRRPFPGGKQYVVSQLRKSYDSNFQWYYGDQLITFNKKQTLEQAQFPWRSCHDGFGLSEDELFQNGITVTDDDSKPGNNSQAERIQLTNLMAEDSEALRLGFEEKFDLELHRDGIQSSDAVAGLDHLVSITPTVGVVGGIDRTNYPWWRNQVATGVTQANLIDIMEKVWRLCSRNGGRPDYILAGSAFIDLFRAAAGAEIARYIVPGNNVSIDPAVADLAFHRVPIVWDPVFDDLDVLLAPATPWEKRCYFINTKHMQLRPAEGHDMKSRRPSRVYNRYVNYFGLTWKGALTINRANSHAVVATA